MIVDKKIFLENPVFKDEFIFTDKRKREKEISFEESISIKDNIKIISITLHLKHKVKILLKPWESLSYTHILEKGIENDLLVVSATHLDKIFDIMNLVLLRTRFYIENNRIFVTEIEGEKEFTLENYSHPERFIEVPGNSYIFSDNWFIYSLFGNSLFLEGVRPSIIFFEKPETFENLSYAKPRVFIIAKENFEKNFEKINDKNVYFYIYDTEDKTKDKIVTSEKNVEEIIKLILKSETT